MQTTWDKIDRGGYMQLSAQLWQSRGRWRDETGQKRNPGRIRGEILERIDRSSPRGQGD